MRFRKLRIAWSLTWCAVALMLSVFWVRSYTHGDWVTSPRISIAFLAGLSEIELSNVHGWSYGSDDVTPDVAENLRAVKSLGYTTAPFALWVRVWILVLAAAVFAIAPWLRLRFSLRTLLLGITLVAIGLVFLMWGTA